MSENKSETYDVIIIGAGISGINFAYRLQERQPHLTYTILDARDAIGGTWDLFKYPGIRSDSDLYTFGFPWSPWTEKTSIAEGPLIVNYIQESAARFGIDKKIQFGSLVKESKWSSESQRWSLDVDLKSGRSKKVDGKFLLFCTGYYDYKEPLKVEIPGIENFRGTKVHPQFWPQDLDYSDKEMVIIGSGATAITLLPALTAKAKHVTMLQRSPSYLLSQPSEDGLEKLIRRWAPQRWISSMIRFKWLAVPWMLVNFCKYFPTLAKKLFRSATIAQLPKEIAHDPHFKPSYNPFDQRVCFCPNGDFYRALRKGDASVVTGQILDMTADTIKLTDGQELRPDIIVTATGLKIQLAGGMRIFVDGKAFNISEKFMWKNVMLQDLPNAAYVIGYVDASWTLGADATAQLVCRMLAKMQKQGYTVAVPRVDESKKKMKQSQLLNLSSTYVKRANSVLPMAGDLPQWRGRTSYFRDIWQAWFGDISTGLQYIQAPMK
ncbi:FAD/NAD(P)-binding domain-containing protein [Tothia fuscella]|uniref:FAD/NAD(P)-binding domain-containing protein n=1 Tax=Tothia fuscella TaxID=1048955 RepID=A0A9P4P1W2_9PEZI|nr:FAD/NAD(P)-binding domain-containing protein [Tothia fuscella]